jgi:hypothetical protein
VRVLVACEFSGIVRDAFAAHGHDAWSCDLLPSERPGKHLRGDVCEVLGDGWDLMIAHPPCTHLAVSGARWFKDKLKEQEEALEFVRRLLAAPVERIALENPVSIISSKIRKPDQIIQPWHFGHGEIKSTCLWLKNLPLLVPTRVVEGRVARVHREPPSPERWKNRSRTMTGIAAAMAAQWGGVMAKDVTKAPCRTCGHLSATVARDKRGLCFKCLYLPEPLGAQIILPEVVLPPPVKEKRPRVVAVNLPPVKMPMLPFEAKKKIAERVYKHVSIVRRQLPKNRSQVAPRARGGLVGSRPYAGARVDGEASRPRQDSSCRATKRAVVPRFLCEL